MEARFPDGSSISWPRVFSSSPTISGSCKCAAGARMALRLSIHRPMSIPEKPADRNFPGSGRGNRRFQNKIHWSVNNNKPFKEFDPTRIRPWAMRCMSGLVERMLFLAGRQ